MKVYEKRGCEKGEALPIWERGVLIYFWKRKKGPFHVIHVNGGVVNTKRKRKEIFVRNSLTEKVLELI